MKRFATLACLTALLASTGCLKRSEVVTVFPDGSSHIMHFAWGDEDDIRNGDALPSKQSGWMVEEIIEKDEDDDEESVKQVAMRWFKPGQQFPTSFAPTGTRLENKALRFSTTTSIEKRKDGTYYHFKRVYHRRLTAEINGLRKDILENEEIEKIGEKDPEKLTVEDREMLAKALIKFEQAKTAVFVDQAAQSTGNAIPQDTHLKARLAAAKAYDNEKLIERAMELLSQEEPEPELFDEDRPDTPEKKARADEEIRELERQVLAQIEAAISTVLKEAGSTNKTTEGFVDAYRLARERFEIAEDLGDEDISFQLILPGRIIAHNCLQDPKPLEIDSLFPDGADDDMEQISQKMKNELDKLRTKLGEGSFQEASWEASGEDLTRQDIVMMATSFVPTPNKE